MAEKRLIDANEIVAVAERAYDAWNLAMAAADGKREINLVYKRQELCKAVKAVAEKCPTVDAVEVVHGCTVPAEQPKKVLLDRKCGICDSLMLSTDVYCPNCGARMDFHSEKRKDEYYVYQQKETQGDC